MSTQQFGGWLRHAREARGLSVAAIASQTKIPPRHLEALERGETLSLPAFYQRAEVRAVARAVGVDEQLAVARLDAELAPVEPPLPPPPLPAASPRVRSEYVLAVVVIGFALGLASWGSFDRTDASEGVAEAPAPVTAQTAAPVATVGSSELSGSPAPQIDAPVTVPVADLAAAETAPVAPAGPTELVIRTEPVGARVTVNGIGWGASPITIRHVEPGEKRVRVTMDGYTGVERSVTVDEGSRATLRIRLTPGS